MKTPLRLAVLGPLLALTTAAYAAVAPVAPPAPPALPFTKATVIAGAQFFADHCSACHAVSNLRYDRLAVDLGMTKTEIQKTIMLPGGASYLKGMKPAMTQAQAKKWLGLPPPNLSHMARALGPRFLYTYLTSFYWDPKRPSGWNNHVFPNVAMPNILAPWGGIYTKTGKLLVPGRESPAAYHRQVAEVVAFLRYASDPSVFERRALGRYVIGVFVILSILAYLLKKDYWQEVWAGKVRNPKTQTDFSPSTEGGDSPHASSWKASTTTSPDTGPHSGP